MQINEGGMFQEIISAIVAAAVGGVAWAIRNTYGRIRKLEDCTVRKSEFEELEKSAVKHEVFDERMERAETDRREMREGIVKLFDKIDEIKTILIKQNTDG
jgi:hypothetical protein